MEIGADDQNRTGDLRVTSALLYQLSYIGFETGIKNQKAAETAFILAKNE